MTVCQAKSEVSPLSLVTVTFALSSVNISVTTFLRTPDTDFTLTLFPPYRCLFFHTCLDLPCEGSHLQATTLVLVSIIITTIATSSFETYSPEVSAICETSRLGRRLS